MPLSDDTATAILGRVKRLARGDTDVQDRALYSWEEAAVALKTGRDPLLLGEDAYEDAVESVKHTSLSPAQVRDRAQDNSCEWLWSVELPSGQMVPGEAIKTYRKALASDSVRERHRAEAADPTY